MEPVYYKITKKDWKLYQERLPKWQEAYMGKLVQEYAQYLQGKDPASTKFWTLWKKMREDKKHPGVRCEVSKGTMIDFLMRFLYDGVITDADLDGFSEELRKYLVFFRKSIERMARDLQAEGLERP